MAELQRYVIERVAAVERAQVRELILVTMRSSITDRLLAELPP